MEVVVGSKNPMKLQVAVKVFLDAFPEEEIKFTTCAAESGVSDQPYGIEETKTGAHNRAEDSFKKCPKADYFIGLEGGVEIIEEDYWATAWICVRDREGRVGFGRTGSFQLPEEIIELLKGGKELAKAADIIFEDEDSGKKGGIISFLTDGIVTRADSYTNALRFALLPFTKRDLYK